MSTAYLTWCSGKLFRQYELIERFLTNKLHRITYGTFLFFGSCTVLAILFAWLFIPETKGVQLEDMDLLFGRDVPIRANKATASYNEAIAAKLAAESHGREKEMVLAEVERA